jgi:hypothetical protein
VNEDVENLETSDVGGKVKWRGWFGKKLWWFLEKLNIARGVAQCSVLALISSTQKQTNPT